MTKNSLVLYKSIPSVITDIEGDKFLIKFCSEPATSTGKKAVYKELKVREKDIVLLHKGPVPSLELVLKNAETDLSDKVRETYELLISDESTANERISLSDLCEYALGKFDVDFAWSFFNSLLNNPEFNLLQDEYKNGNVVFIPRKLNEINEINQKKFEKEHEAEIRNEFISRLKNRQLNLPSDSKFMGEVEAFALNKTEKSKILMEAGITQTVENAHKILIETGIWNFTKNPYPTRFGFSFDSAREQLGKMPEEEREEVPCTCYAIDSENSLDPDDAIGFDGKYYWVCIADPASSVKPDSSIDVTARSRGTTLYIPEGASRMLCESSLEEYALGLKEKQSNDDLNVKSNALAFKLKLDDECQIESCDIKIVRVHVKMISYEYAQLNKDLPEFKPFFDLAARNLERRLKNHAVSIQMPEVHIEVDKETKKVSITPEIHYESNKVVQEFMLLAGEGAAKFAFKNQIPFPFVSQEAPEFPDNLPDGLAGEFARVKCMRKRSVGITPSIHSGLGLSFYSQVTSPLRRYSDLVSHQQLRSFIKGEPVLGKDEMLERIAAGDAASLAARKASRLSETHWKLVYLLQNPQKTFEAICIDKRGTDALFLIPSLDMQTTIKACQNINLNDKVNVRSANIDVTTQNVDFIFSDVVV